MERLHRAASCVITGCLSSSSIPLLLSEASLPPIQVTLTYFTLLSYERALRLPTSFPISGLARLGKKPDSADRPGELLRQLTRSCFLLLLLGRLFLLALSFLLGICLRSPWSPPFPLHALALTPLYLAAKVRLSPTLTLFPHDLVLWTNGSVSFPFGKGGSGVLTNCSLDGTEATLSFSAGPVGLSFSIEACAILHALCWSWQHQQVCHFSSLLLLSDSRSILATLSSPPSFLLSQTLWQIWQELSSLSSCSIRLRLLLTASSTTGDHHA